MKLNNRGMSLIEMVVAFAILGVVSVSILSMMLTATKTYTRFTYMEKLQQEAQLAMANVERRVMNCSEGISWNASTKELFIVTNEAGVRKIQVIYLDTTKKELYYGIADLADDNTATIAFYLLAEHVETFDVSFKEDATVSPVVRTAADITVTLKRNDKACTSQKIVALRNRPVNCSGILYGTGVSVTNGQ